MSRTIDRLEPGQPHLWWLDLQQLPPAVSVRLTSHLSDGELDRLSRIVDPCSRRQFAAGRGMLRELLQLYLIQQRGVRIAPADLQLLANQFGRPELLQSCAGTPIQFNLSHAAELVICGFSALHPIGVDVEWLPRKVDVERIAARYFAATELEDANTSDPVERRRRFFQLWTLKEAFMKARGRGLSIGLDRVRFRYQPATGQFVFDPAPELNSDPGQWTFEQPELFPEYQLALALELPPTAARSARLFPFSAT